MSIGAAPLPNAQCIVGDANAVRVVARALQPLEILVIVASLRKFPLPVYIGWDTSVIENGNA
jgi:hypothetical protein